MLSQAQNLLYWRRWAFVSKANGWRMRAGHLQTDRAVNSTVSPTHAAVWAIATVMAEQRASAVEPDDLRHACGVLACRVACLGPEAAVELTAPAEPRLRTHSALNNKEFDALLALWGNGAERQGLLISPDLVSADQLNPQRGERRRREWRIRKAAPKEYVDAILEDQRPGHIMADGLQRAMIPVPMADLRRLTVTMSERTDRFTRPKRQVTGNGAHGVAALPGAVNPENCPF